MFRLFKKPIVNETDRDKKLLFQLSDDVQIIIGLNEPPLYSRGYLCVGGKRVANVSIHPDKVEEIQHYADSMQSDDTNSNKFFLAKLEELKLTKFVEEIDKYTHRTSPCENGVGSIPI